MPTRSFVIEQNGKKRFWDVTWEGGHVEVSAGAWGTSGRARERAFVSVEARDAFIDDEVRKVLKKGYVEMQGVAPVGDAKTKAIDTRVSFWRKRLEAFARPAWLPVFGSGSEAHGSVRGPCTLLPHEGWPECPSCHRPLSALLELDCSRLPDPALKQKALVQLFCCEAWESAEPQSSRCIFDGWLARLHPLAGTPREGPWNRGQPTAIVGWTAIEELPPRIDESLREPFENEDADVIAALLESVGEAPDTEDAYAAWARGSGKAARNAHKLGGWPTFVQDVVPFAHQLFQIESTLPFDVNFGDVGAGHLLLTAKRDVRFSWASH